MSSNRSCVVKEFPLPDREYHVAPARCWDADLVSPAPPHRIKRRRRSLLPLLLLGLVLFGGGFLLGRAALAKELPAQACGTPVSILAPEGGGRTDGQMPELPAGQENPDWTALGQEPVLSVSPEDWSLILVNWENPLPEDFSIPRLTQLANGHAIDSRAYPALQSMMDAARAEGLQPTICSSYRTREKQEELFQNKVQRLLAEGYGRTEAEEQAAMWVARPGTSEHQAGLAVDIVDKSYQLLDRGQENTAVQQWLMAHCAEYGYILRYPTDKAALTGVNYEPWHYRYVGAEAAAEIMERGICLEEYLAEISG
ncbi:M15 family metallopeptidase [Oscillibacter sp. 1-3]|uniref:M15 family metallopeptidase n=1 Tax=Oscillibacter sp. 1-3 TaxID=1235797 RepID=UPI000339B5B4|nr:M15 family metallopeptidase [Oscillibacter sp. 1-3]EOS64229.1 hypothetical protein C816_03096 [Oscillibacter sp. 1-3]